jgi:hypothetical protein
MRTSILSSRTIQPVIYLERSEPVMAGGINRSDYADLNSEGNIDDKLAKNECYIQYFFFDDL